MFYFSVRKEMFDPLCLGKQASGSFQVKYHQWCSGALKVCPYIERLLFSLLSFYIVLKDIDLYYEKTDTPAMARNSNLNEELGQVWSQCATFVQCRGICVGCLLWCTSQPIANQFCTTLEMHFIESIASGNTELGLAQIRLLLEIKHCFSVK